jgi:NAD(P)-dependent dehydrogenase (short-subunit alcohol dehydrogenase family)
MVKLAAINKCIARADEASIPRVAVFVGGTSGIGKLALGGLVRLGTNIRVYVVGRRETLPSFQPYIDELGATNSKAEIVWIEGQVTLLSEVKRVCEDIKKRESSIDLLFLTPGYPPFSGRNG